MEVVLGIFVVVVAIAAYVYLSYLLWVTFALPVALTLLGIGVIVGVVLVLAVAGRVLFDRDTSGHGPVEVFGPDDVDAGRFGGRKRPNLPRRDSAWPQYFVLQPWSDLGAIASVATGLVALLWANAGVALAALFPWSLVVWPASAIALCTLLTFTGGAIGGLALVAAVLALVTALAWLIGSSVSLLLRFLDLARQWRFRTHASCPRCFAVSSLPAFACSHCGWLHRDVHAGILGVFYRRCRCGTVLPTTVWRAAAQLQAFCPICPVEAPTELHRGAAEVTDIRVPVFGAASAGKSRLIMAGLVALGSVARREAPLEFPDDVSRAAYERAASTVREDPVEIPKTQESERPRPISLLFRSGRRRALIHVFDAAGELYTSREHNADLAYLDRARGLIFVLDPFSIPDVRDHLGADSAEALQQANAALHDPEDSFNATAARLRQFGVATRRQRLAFVLSKADLLARWPIGAELRAESAAIREWLIDRGLDNLVTQATRDFKQVEFFLVTARGNDSDADISAIRPFVWLLRSESFAPAEPASAVTGRS